MSFKPMGSKHCNTYGRSVWTARRTMLKNKLHLVTFHESILVSLWTFQLTLGCKDHRTNLKVNGKKSVIFLQSESAQQNQKQSQISLTRKEAFPLTPGKTKMINKLAKDNKFLSRVNNVDRAIRTLYLQSFQFDDCIPWRGVRPLPHKKMVFWVWH